MNRLIQSLKTIVHSEPPRFILICLRIGSAFLFFLGTLFAYSKMMQFGNVAARVSAAQIPGGWIFEILTWGLMLGYFWAELDGRKALKQPLLIAQAGQASILWLWGLVVHSALVEEAKSYLNASAVLGFGFWFMLITIGLLWFVAFGEKILMPILAKLAPASAEPVEPEAAVVEPAVEPEPEKEPEPEPVKKPEPEPVKEPEPEPEKEPEIPAEPSPEPEIPVEPVPVQEPEPVPEPTETEKPNE